MLPHCGEVEMSKDLWSSDCLRSVTSMFAPTIRCGVPSAALGTVKVTPYVHMRRSDGNDNILNRPWSQRRNLSRKREVRPLGTSICGKIVSRPTASL